MPAVSWTSLGITLGLDLSVCLAVLLAFNFTRVTKHAKRYYAAKRYLRIPFRYRPRKVSRSFFFWWVPLLRYSDEELAACAGMDALTVIRFLDLGFELSIGVALICVILVLPANWIGGGQVACAMAAREDYAAATASGCDVQQRTKAVYGQFDKTSMANIEPGSHLLWCHLIATYLISALTMRLLWSSQISAVAWRVRYLSSTRKGAESHTIMVQDIPGTLSGTFVGRVYEHLDGRLGRLLPRSTKERVTRLVEGSRSLHTLGSEAMRITGVDALLRTLTVAQHPHSATTPKGHSPGASASPSPMTARSQDSPYGGNVYLSKGLKSTLPRPRASLTSHASLTSPTYNAGATTVPLGTMPRSLERNLSSQSAASSTANGVDDTTPPDVPSGPELKSLARRAQRTGFDTWGDAEEALAVGMAMHDIVTKEFERTYPEGEIVNVTMAVEDHHLRRLVDRYNALKTELEDLMDSWTISLQRGKRIKRPTRLVHPAVMGSGAIVKWGAQSLRVDAVDLLTWQLETQWALIQEEHDAVSAKPAESATAFVTFASRVTQSQAATSLHYHTETFWSTSPAPGPLDVIWANVNMRAWERTARFLAAWALFALIVFTFAIPVTAVQAWLSVDKVKTWSVTAWMFDYPLLKGLIQGILPSLALMVFLIIVPIILAQINHLQGIASWPQLEFEVGRKFYAFLVIVVFLGTCISSSLTVSSLFDSAKVLATMPTVWLNSLGNQISTNATFFLTYILLSALVSRPLVFLRIPGLIVYIIQSMFSGTVRAKRRLWGQQFMTYGADIPRHSLIILLLLVFSVQQPFLALACIAYFAVNCVTARYQLLYVFREQFQSGGRFWPIIFDQLFTGLLTFQIVMAVLLALKQFVFTPLLLLPIAVSLVFRVTVARHFDRPLNNLSLHAAADLDRSEEQQSDEDRLAEERTMLATLDCEYIALGPVSELYLPPSHKVSAADHDALLQELYGLVARVGGTTYEPRILQPIEERSGQSEDGTSQHHSKLAPSILSDALWDEGVPHTPHTAPRHIDDSAHGTSDLQRDIAATAGPVDRSTSPAIRASPAMRHYSQRDHSLAQAAHLPQVEGRSVRQASSRRSPVLPSLAAARDQPNPSADERARGGGPRHSAPHGPDQV